MMIVVRPTSRQELSLYQVVAAEARKRCGLAMAAWMDDPQNPEKRATFLHAIQALETAQKAVKENR